MFEQVMVRTYSKDNGIKDRYLADYFADGYVVKFATAMDGYIEYILEKDKSL